MAANNSLCEQTLSEVRKRFYRIPSSGMPQFLDIKTGIRQCDPIILKSFYNDIAPPKNSNVDLQSLIDHLLVIYGESFVPNGDQILSDKNLNLWSPPEITMSGAKVENHEVPLFLELLERWFPKQGDYNYFLCWLAHSIRFPEKRIVATPLLRAEHGVGKGFLVETLLSTLLGCKSVAVCDISDVTGEFNDVLEGKTLILIDEAYNCKPSQLQRLKSLQGNQTIALKRKHKQIVTINNFVNFIMASNDHVPLKIEAGDRRFWVPQFIKHEVSIMETSTFINTELKPWLKSHGGFQAVRDWLEGVDLSGFYPNSTPPMTDEKRRLMGVSGQKDELLISIKKHLVGASVTNVADLLKVIKVEIPDVNEISIANVLKSMGCIRKRTRNSRLWITPEGLSRGLSLSSKPIELKSYLVKLEKAH